MSFPVVSTSNYSIPNAEQDSNRRTASYHSSIWGDHFLSYAGQDNMKPDPEVEKRIQALKAEVGKLIISTTGFDKMTLVDALQRLGVAYHFENEIKEVLQSIYNSYAYQSNDNLDLYRVSLGFRILRQQGYKLSADIFKQFKDEKNEFKAKLTTDGRALLCLFEASHLRIQGEDILEEASKFARKRLKSSTLMPYFISSSTSTLAEQVKHSLEIPLHKGMQRLEARHYISIYEADDAQRNDLLLELAKMDFNLLQGLHQRELGDISRWWKGIDFTSKLPFARDRLVECYFWMLGVYFEPKYSKIRIFMTKIIAIASVIDDIYDVYGTLEELKLFTQAIERWEVVAANELPEYMQLCYFVLLEVVKEMEDKLVNQGQSYRMYYAKEAIKGLARAYFVEAIWFHTKYVPSFEEYLENSIMSSGYPMLAVEALIDLEDEIATKEALDWVISVPRIIRSSALIARLVDDIHTSKVEQERGDAASSVQCYMQEHGVSEEEARKKIKEMVDIAWMNINEEIQQPNHLPLPLLLPSLNLARMMEVLYENGDGYTNSSGKTKDRISSLLVNPIPM